MCKLIETDYAPLPQEKGELAQLYSPTATRKSALRLFNKYLHRAHGLLEALDEVGYIPAARHLTRRQVEVIVEYLGEP